MLVLTRKTEEKIVIGKKKEIVITILKIQGDKVSIGITAPEDEYPVIREELLRKGVDVTSQRGIVQRHSIPAKDLQEKIQSKAHSET